MANYPQIVGGGITAAILDPATLAAQAPRQGTPTDFVGLANSYRCPRGTDAGEAWLLMLRSDLDALNAAKYLDNPCTLTWISDFDTLTVKKLWFVKAVCMTPGPTAADPNAAYLVQWRDKRHLLAMSGTDGSSRQYNVRCPAPPATSGAKLYYASTLNSGAVWTWQYMLNDLWATLPSGLAGAVPTLPFTPNGTPENWRFIGTTAWRAIEQILGKIGVDLVYNPQADTFSLVQLGQSQPTASSSSFATLASRLIGDYWPLETNQGRFPEKIRVLFPVFIPNYGSDADTEQGTPTGTNPVTKPAYSIDVATSVPNALAGTLVPLWDDLCAIYSGNGSGDPQNSTALSARATEVAGNFVNRRQTSYQRLRKQYSGISTAIPTGSQITAIVWADYGAGLFTEYLCAPEYGPAAIGAVEVRPYDLGRRTLENYPDKLQIVQITSLSAVSGLYPGTVIRCVPDTGTILNATAEVCWVKLQAAFPAPPTLNEFYMGRLAGTISAGGNAHPVYIVLEHNPFQFIELVDTGSGYTLNDGDSVKYSAHGGFAAPASFSYNLANGTVTVPVAGAYWISLTISASDNRTPDSSVSSPTGWNQVTFVPYKNGVSLANYPSVLFKVGFIDTPAITFSGGGSVVYNTTDTPVVSGYWGETLNLAANDVIKFVTVLQIPGSSILVTQATFRVEYRGDEANNPG